jgi:L-amino acid N-acyltransferase YncA
MDEKLTIRFAKFSDLPSIVHIYNQAIRSKRTTGDTEEFRVNDRIKWFEKYTEDEYPLYIAEIATTVVGYCTLSPYRSERKAMSTVAEISYYVDYTIHGNGIGTALLNYVISDCKRIGKESLLAILLDINSQSVGILEKFKFIKWGHFPDIININEATCGHLIYGLKINS